MPDSADGKTSLTELPPLPPEWKRVADHKERWERMRLEAQAVAREFARILVEKYGARRVWLYGSAAGEWVFHDGSDVDMAVEGLDGPLFSRAESELQGRTRFRLDLWPRDWLNDELWAKMIPEPVLLAERRDETDQGT